MGRMSLRRSVTLSASAVVAAIACNDVKTVDGDEPVGGGGAAGEGGSTPEPVKPGIHVDMDCGNGNLVLAVCQPADLLRVGNVDATFECYANNDAFVGGYFEHPDVGPVAGTEMEYAVLNGRCPGVTTGFTFTVDTRAMAGESVLVQTFEPDKKIEGRFTSADGLFHGTFSLNDPQ